MSRQRFRGGVMGLMVVALVLFVGLGLILIAQIFITKGILTSKKSIQNNMYIDDRGSEMLSLMKSGSGGITTMYILGSLAAEDYKTNVWEELQRIEQRIETIGLTHELVIAGESIAYYLGKDSRSNAPTYTQPTSQSCGSDRVPIDISLKWISEGKRISSGWGYRDIGGVCDCHGGMDVGGVNDAYAAADGILVDVYPKKGDQACIESTSDCTENRNAPGCRCNRGYGNMIIIEHNFNGINYRSYYYHLKSVEPGLNVGSTVSAGQLIGVSGNSGHSQAAHLHYELRVPPWTADKDSVSPCSLFETKDWIGNCVHEIPAICKSFKVYGSFIPVPGAQPGNYKKEVSLRAW